MNWKYLLIFDLLYTFMFILVLSWYYPKTFNVLSGYAPDIFESIIVFVLVIIWYLLLAFNVIKVFSE